MNYLEKIRLAVHTRFLVPCQTAHTQKAIAAAIAKGIGTGNKYEHKQVVCVATTIPKRMATLHLSIQSILRQTIRPHKVVIYLGKELFEGVELTVELKALEAHGVEFRYVHDVRVHTKYFYAFQDFPDSYVMTFDDDILYHPQLLEQLLKAAEKNHGCITCSRAHRILGSDDGFASYNKWGWEVSCRKPSHLLLPTGVGGVLYQPSLFGEELFDADAFLNLSANNDDLWLKYVELKSRIPAVTLSGRRMYVEIEGSQVVSLNSSNVHKNVNDVYWENLMNYARMNYGSLLALEQEIGRR